MADEDDTEVCELSDYARSALLNFLEENYQRNELDDNDAVDEDWELSQFWYNEETSSILAKAALASIDEGGRIACVSCPSAFNFLKKLAPESDHHYLFEYDKRFLEKFPDHMIFYNYNEPLQLDEKFKLNFDLVLADPPYLSGECLVKFSETIKFLTNKKIVLCTGAVMEGFANELLGLKPCKFVPRHERCLGNEFQCYTNFPFDEAVSKVKSAPAT